MKVEKLLILIMTVLGGALFLLSACLAAWFFLQGAVFPALLQLFASSLTFAGTMVGIWWIRNYWRD